MAEAKTDATELSFRLKAFDIAIAVVGTAMVVYHAVYSMYIIHNPELHQNAHLGFALILTFLIFARAARKLWPLLLALAAVSFFCWFYIEYNYNALYWRIMYNTPTDLVVGAILILLVVGLVWKRFGKILATVVCLCIAYMFLGQYLPGVFQTMPFPPDKVLSRLSMSFSGIFGTVLDVSASYIFLFMVFGALMQTCGAVGFFLELGKFIGGRMRSGSAVTAIATSSMVGMVSGQVAPIVAIVGSYSVPMMAKAGYKLNQGAAIIAAGGTGALIIPPVMGTIAFIMAGITGIPYARIIGIAVIPAALYVICCLLYSHFQAEKLRIVRVTAEVDRRELLLRAPLFFIPFAIIIALFIAGRPPLQVGFWACVSVIILSLFRKQTRPSLGNLVKGFVSGADTGSQIAIACAGMGMLMTVIIVTGLGVKLAAGIVGWTGGNIIALLVITAVIMILMGTGLPAGAGYIIVAVTIIPVMLSLGLDLLTVHFFAMYFTIFAFLTPPVALSALFASRVAGSDYMRTALEATKVGVAGWLIPFMAVFCPAVLLNFSDPLNSVTGLISCLVILLGLQAGFVGYYLKDLSLLERVLSIISAIALIIGLYYSTFANNYSWFGVGMGIFAVLTLWQFIRRVQHKEKAIPFQEPLSDK